MSQTPQPPHSSHTPGPPGPEAYPLTFDVAYPDRELDRLSTGFRVLAVIPIAIVLTAVSATQGSGAMRWAPEVAGRCSSPWF